MSARKARPSGTPEGRAPTAKTVDAGTDGRRAAARPSGFPLCAGMTGRGAGLPPRKRGNDDAEGRRERQTARGAEGRRLLPRTDGSADHFADNSRTAA